MTKDEVIDQLWEISNHGTRREDVVAAYEAGAAAERDACAKVCDDRGIKFFPKSPFAVECHGLAAAIRAMEST